MNNDARKEWLASLKVGDRVAVSISRAFYGSYHSILEVKHITPSRNRFDIGYSDEEHVFLQVNRDGMKFAGRGSYGAPTIIEPVTDKILAEINLSRLRNNLNSRIKNVQKTDALNADQITRIIAIFEETP